MGQGEGGGREEATACTKAVQRDHVITRTASDRAGGGGGGGAEVSFN